jgi:hypothetical protein
MEGENKHLRSGHRLEDLAGCLLSVQPWHSDVKDNDVRLRPFRFLDCLVAIACFLNYLPIGSTREEFAQAFADHRVTIRQHYANLFHEWRSESGKIARTVVPLPLDSISKGLNQRWW